MKNRRTLIIVALVVLLSGAYGVSKWLYSRHHVTTDNAQVDGRLVPVAARLQGYVARVLVDDNTPVAEGDTLVVLETADLDAAVAKAEAALDAAIARAGTAGRGGELAARATAARASAEASGAGVARAEANAAHARADLARIGGLAEKGIVPAQQLDAAQAAARAASAELDAARRQQAAAEAQVAVAVAAGVGGSAEVASARAALTAAELQRSYAVLVAPVSGVVSHRAVEPGALLQPGQTAMMVVPDREIWVTANVKETALARVQVGDPVEFTVDGYGSTTFRGRVESLAPATGARFALLPPDNATGNFTKVVQNVPVRIAVDESRDPDHPLRPGMSVEVAITTDRADS